MDYNGKNQGEPNFSNYPAENLRFENEFLKLKMQAERGAVFGGNMAELPPGIEALFLKNVQQFEDSFDRAELITINEYIGSPTFKKCQELKPGKVEAELRRLMDLLHAKNIVLEVLGQYDFSIIYRFITEELLFEKIRDVDFPGYIHHFIYEEFYPDHNADIKRTAQEFIDHWFEKSFDEYCGEFAQQLVTAEGKIFSKDEVIRKLNDCIDSYESFTNIGFMACDTSFEWNETENKDGSDEHGLNDSLDTVRDGHMAESGMGHAEGMFRYDAVIETGETIHIEGPFKLYLINEDGSWRIFYFVFPGFAW